MKRIGWMSAIVIAVLTAQGVTAQTANQSIVGRWQGTFDQNYPMGFLFSPTGKAIMVYGSEPQVLSGVALNYKIDASHKPMHVDFTLPGGKETVLTIADLPTPQTLRLQLKDTNPGKPRPTVFSDQNQMQKISDRAIEPLNSAKFTQAAQSTEGRLVIQSLAQSALFYTVESNQFPTTLEQLGLPIASTQNYRYQLQVQPKQITLIARPKKANLKSYISIVMQRTERQVEFVSTAVCQSVRPSLIAPPVPRIASTLDSFVTKQPVACGIGSEPLKF